MDAKPVLASVGRALREVGLEAILIGNAAAAIQGAPVTTVDLDFLIRKNAANMNKLKRVADVLGAVVFMPHYPVSELYRLFRDDDQLQLDFMVRMHGVRSFNSLRSRMKIIDVEGEAIAVASLADIIDSKRAADRPRDRAVLDVLEKTLEQKRIESGSAGSSQGAKRTRSGRSDSKAARKADE